MRLVFGASAAPASSCVVCQIYASFDVYSLFSAKFASPRTVLAILDTLPISYYIPGARNLPYSWHCFYVLVKQWSFESQEDAHDYLQSLTRTGWTVFVEAPTAPGRISSLDAKWICGDGRLS